MRRFVVVLSLVCAACSADTEGSPSPDVSINPMTQDVRVGADLARVQNPPEETPRPVNPGLDSDQLPDVITQADAVSDSASMPDLLSETAADPSHDTSSSADVLPSRGSDIDLLETDGAPSEDDNGVLSPGTLKTDVDHGPDSGDSGGFADTTDAVSDATSHEVTGTSDATASQDQEDTVSTALEPETTETDTAPVIPVDEDDPCAGIAPKGECIIGKFLKTCVDNLPMQQQCVGAGNQCGTNSDDYALCFISACEPNCAALSLGQIDGCGRRCGEGSLCGDSFAAHCSTTTPELVVSCQENTVHLQDCGALGLVCMTGDEGEASCQ